jgi:hypothetical protein
MKLSIFLCFHILYMLCSIPQYIQAQSIDTPTKQDSLFVEALLRDKKDNSYYIAVNIKAQDYEGRVVIENLMMYRFLHLTQNMDWQQYTQLMRDILLSNDTLKTVLAINEIDESGNFKKWSFYRVETDEEVQRYALLGKDEFLNHFFQKSELIGELKDDIYGNKNDKERFYLVKAIINQLFEWNIYTCRQGYTGNLIYLTDKRAAQVQQQWKDQVNKK